MARQMPMTREEAEMLAIDGLQYIASDGEILGRFLALTGIAPADLRDAATSDDFLSGVLDYFMGDERLLMAYCGARALDPARIGLARNVLSRQSG